jgi:hypothetical protein
VSEQSAVRSFGDIQQWEQPAERPMQRAAFARRRSIDRGQAASIRQQQYKSFQGAMWKNKIRFVFNFFMLVFF